MDNKTIEKNNTMQFRPNKNDCINIYEFTLMKCSSYYFSTSTRKLFNSKIKRVLLVDVSEDRKNSTSNLFSVYGYKPYDYKNIITLLIEEVQRFYDDEKEYKIIVLHNNKMLFEKADNFFTDYQQARIELNRLEEELKISLDCLNSFR
tara:strand:+ start:2361 stop:2804 length:444 start_codon:yes stop_codon:yes gene_type:complete